MHHMVLISVLPNDLKLTVRLFNCLEFRYYWVVFPVYYFGGDGYFW